MKKSFTQICDIPFFLAHYYALSSMFCQDKESGFCYFYRLTKQKNHIELQRIEEEKYLMLIHESLRVLPRFFLNKEFKRLHIEPCTEEQKELLVQYIDFYQEIIRKHTGELVTHLANELINSTMTQVYVIYQRSMN